MNQSRHFRFSLRSMFIFFVPVAVFCTVAREQYYSPVRGGYPDLPEAVAVTITGLLAAATSLIVIGNAGEIGHFLTLWVQLRKQNQAVRFGWILAVVWRCLLIGILVSFWVVVVLVSREEFSYTEPEGFYFPYIVHRVLFYFALLCAIGGTGDTTHVPSLWSHLANALASFCGVFLLVFIAWQIQELPFRVHVATTGIQYEQPAKFTGPSIDLPLVERTGPFITRTITLTAIVPIVFLAIRQFAVYGRSIGCRLSWLAIILVSLLTHGVNLYWLTTRDIVAANESFAEPFAPVGADTALAAIGLVVLLSAAISHRLIAHPMTAIDDCRELPREKDSTQLHHRGGVLGVLCAALGVYLLFQLFDEFAAWELLEGYWVLSVVHYRQDVCAGTAVFLASVGCVWRCFRGRSKQHEIEWSSVSPVTFIVVFPSMCVAISFAVATLAALGFSLWLVSWHDAPWLDWLIELAGPPRWGIA